MGAARESLGQRAMSFTRPDLLPLALVLPALIAFGIWAYARRRGRAARALGDLALVRRLGGGDLGQFPTRRLLTLGVAALALGIALAGPRWGWRAVAEQSHSLDIVLALDVSKSMLAADVEPNRLERERLFVRRLLRELAGERIGMVVFAGRAYVVSPLTVDHGALNLYLDALAPDVVSQGGSSLAAAIAQATDLARGSEETGGDRTVVLVSDGEALEDESAAMSAAERAARAGVSIFTIGIGTARGAPVPEPNPDTREAAGYVRDPGSGEIVVSRLNEQLLSDIATAAGGSYLTLERPGSLDALVSALRGLERGPLGSDRRVEQPERFAYFVAIALLLIALDTAWPALAALRARRSAEPGRAVVPRAVVLLLLTATLGFGIGDVERGNRHYRAGRYAEAVEAYQAAIRDGNTSPGVRYNLGTALLQLGRYDEAGEQLRLALDGIDPELRRRALYNLGNRYLGAARSSPEAALQGRLLDEALEAYKGALRLEPADSAAKWNLEMALRERDQQQQQQQQQQQAGGAGEQDPQPQQDPQQGGSGNAGAGGSESEQRVNPTQGRDEPMSREQADRILSAVEQDERELTREKLRKGQRETPVLRDW